MLTSYYWPRFTLATSEKSATWPVNMIHYECQVSTIMREVIVDQAAHINLPLRAIIIGESPVELPKTLHLRASPFDS